MFVECPRCQALYRIGPNQLNAADGWVRCGECRHEFQAYDTLSDKDEHHPQLPLISSNTTEQASNPGDRPEELTLTSSTEILQTTSKRRNTWLATLLWTIAILILILLLGGQYIISNRSQLSQIPALRPWISRLCAIRDCKLPPLRALNEIKLLNHNIATDPQKPQTLTLTGTIENTASFPQPFPVIQISFSNIQGQIVATGRFKPTQYLPPQTASKNRMPSNKPIAINVSFQDPGSEAVSYEFSFH